MIEGVCRDRKKMSGVTGEGQSYDPAGIHILSGEKESEKEDEEFEEAEADNVIIVGDDEYRVECVVMRVSWYTSEEDYLSNNRQFKLALVKWEGGVCTWEYRSKENHYFKGFRSSIVSSKDEEYYLIHDPKENDSERERSATNVDPKYWNYGGVFPLQVLDLEQEKELELIDEKKLQSVCESLNDGDFDDDDDDDDGEARLMELSPLKKLIVEKEKEDSELGLGQQDEEEVVAKKAGPSLVKKRLKFTGGGAQQYASMVRVEENRDTVQNGVVHDNVFIMLRNFEEYIFEANKGHEFGVFYHCDELNIAANNCQSLDCFKSGFVWPFDGSGSPLSLLTIIPSGAYNCCGFEGYNGNNYKDGRKNRVGKIGSITMSYGVMSGEKVFDDEDEIQKLRVQPEWYGNMTRLRSEHSSVSLRKENSKSNANVVGSSSRKRVNDNNNNNNDDDSMTPNNGGGGGGGSIAFDPSPVAPKMILNGANGKTRVQRERFERQQKFLICIASDFQYFYFLCVEGSAGVMRKPNNRQRIIMKQRWNQLHCWVLSLKRLLPILYKVQNMLPHTLLGKTLIDYVVLKEAGMGSIGSVRAVFNVEKVKALGPMKVAQMMVSAIREIMDEGFVIKNSVKVVDDIQAAKMHQGSFDKRKGSAAAGEGEGEGRRALWEACELKMGERSGVGNITASSIVISRFAESVYQFLKYLVVQVSDVEAYQILVQCLTRVVSEIKILVAAFERNTDALKVLNIENNMPLMMSLTLRMKTVMEEGIQTLSALVKFMLTGQGGGFKGMSTVERRRYLFSNGILARQLQGYLQAGIALHIGAERAQVFKDCYLLDNNATKVSELSKLGQLFVAAIIYYKGAYYLLICQDKVSRFTDMKIILLPKHLQIAVVLLHEYRFYILNDEEKNFCQIPMVKMKSGMIKNTAG